MVDTNEVITDALDDIKVLAEEEPIEASDARKCVRVFNDMMFMWAAKGINLGFTRVAKLSDPVTVADGAIYGIKKLLALSLVPTFKTQDLDLSDLRVEAREGWDAILNLTVKINRVAYPPTLPIGSGNSYSTYSTSRFYPGVGDAILVETGGYISLEEDTGVST